MADWIVFISCMRRHLFLCCISLRNKYTYCISIFSQSRDFPFPSNFYFSEKIHSFYKRFHLRIPVKIIHFDHFVIFSLVLLVILIEMCGWYHGERNLWVFRRQGEGLWTLRSSRNPIEVGYKCFKSYRIYWNFFQLFSKYCRITNNM